MAFHFVFAVLFCSYIGSCIGSSELGPITEAIKEFDFDSADKGLENVATERRDKPPAQNASGIPFFARLTRAAIPLASLREKREYYAQSYGSPMYSGSGTRYQGGGPFSSYSSNEYMAPSGQYSGNDYQSPASSYSGGDYKQSAPSAVDDYAYSTDDDDGSDGNYKGSNSRYSKPQQPIIYIVSVPVPVPSTYYPPPYYPGSYNYSNPMYGAGQFGYGASPYGPNPYGIGASRYGASPYGIIPGYGAGQFNYVPSSSSYSSGSGQYSPASSHYSSSSYSSPGHSYGSYSPPSQSYGAYGQASQSYGAYGQVPSYGSYGSYYPSVPNYYGNNYAYAQPYIYSASITTTTTAPTTAATRTTTTSGPPRGG